MRTQGVVEPWPWLTPRRVAAVIAIAWLAFGVSTLRRYGITTDAPALFWSGDRTLFWLTHRTLEEGLSPHTLNLDLVPPGFVTEYGRYPDIHDPTHYPVFPGLVAATTSQLFHRTLGWLGDLDGHQLGLVILHCIGLFLFCVYACRLCGRGAGIAATVMLALFPAAVGHAFNNPKDWPCAMFSGVAILAAGVGVVDARARTLLGAGVMFGISLSCKMNGAFALATLFAWSPLAYLLLYRRRRLPARVAVAWMGMPYVAFAIFMLLWPWLWKTKTMAETWDRLQEYVGFMVHYGVGDRTWWTAYPLRCLVYMTPPLVLAVAVIYALTGFRGGRIAVARWSLLLLSVVVPLLRTAAPRSNFYDANRHFIEYVPPLCVMAGAGAATLTQFVFHVVGPTSRAARLVLVAAAVLSVGVLVWPDVVYHPFETMYFNRLIGGLGGAQRQKLFSIPPPHDYRVNGTEGDYWNTSFRDGLRRVYVATPGRNVSVSACSEFTAKEAAAADWPSANKPVIASPEAADYVVLIPRESLCSDPRRAEIAVGRPRLARVEREGGLVYEVLGPRQ